MECEKCQDVGFIEYEAGLIVQFCDCEAGEKAQEKQRETLGYPETPPGPIMNEECQSGNIEATYTGLQFQLQGKRTDEYSDDELWKQCKEAAMEKMEFPHTVDMPCGKSLWFSNQHSILTLPIEDEPCPCGNPKHHIVRFVDYREEVDDSDSRNKPDNQSSRGGDTSKPKQPKKPKAKRKARKRAG